MGIRKKDESRITANEMRYILVIASYAGLHHKCDGGSAVRICNPLHEVELGEISESQVVFLQQSYFVPSQGNRFYITRKGAE